MTTPPTPTSKTFTVHYRGHRTLSAEDLSGLLQTITLQGESFAATAEHPSLLSDDERQAATERLKAHAQATGLKEDALDDDTHEIGGGKGAAQANNDGVSGQIEFLLSHGWTEPELQTRIDELVAGGN